MEDRFTLKMKKKIAAKVSGYEHIDKLSFANGFSMIKLIIFILFCTPAAIIISYNKQYVVGFDKGSHLLLIFRRGIWGGIDGYVEKLPIKALRDLKVEKTGITFTAEDGKMREIYPVLATKGNFTDIVESIKSALGRS